MKSMACLSFLVAMVCFHTSCVSDETRQKREAERLKLVAAEKEKTFNQEAIAMVSDEFENREKQKQEAAATHEEHAKAMVEKYHDNSLQTGATPYATCYGKNRPCSEAGCSKIIIRASADRDVVASIKEGDTFVRHAYVKQGSKYTFEVPAGTYEPFFYSGNGWNPDRKMKDANCGRLAGGFVLNENYVKDKPVKLENKTIMYDLEILQKINELAD